MERELAYWITPSGVTMKPDSYHIVTVQKYPEIFKETKKSLRDTYDKYNEPIDSNIEGKAREAIMDRVIRRGFVRIRKNTMRNNQSWSIQLVKITPKVNDAIWAWSKEMTKYSDKYADVNINFLDSNKMIKTTLDKIASGANIVETCSDNVLRKFVILTESSFGLIYSSNGERKW